MSTNKVFATGRHLENGKEHVVLSVPAFAIESDEMMKDLKKICNELKKEGTSYEIEIVGNTFVSKASNNACYKGINKCRGCCKFSDVFKYCHCNCQDQENHVFVCYGGYQNCLGCDPCGSPECHYPSCNVYHDLDGVITLSGGDTYDPYK